MKVDPCISIGNGLDPVCNVFRLWFRKRSRTSVGIRFCSRAASKLSPMFVPITIQIHAIGFIRVQAPVFSPESVLETRVFVSIWILQWRNVKFSLFQEIQDLIVCRVEELLGEIQHGRRTNPPKK